METINEYRKRKQTWKPESYNFKTNGEVITFLDNFKHENGLANRGVALDFVVRFFKSVYGKGKEVLGELQGKLDTAEAENGKFEKQVQNLTTEKEELNEKVLELTEKVRQAGESTTDKEVLEELEALRTENVTMKADTELLKADAAAAARTLIEKFPELNGMEIKTVADILSAMEKVLTPYKLRAEGATAIIKKEFLDKPFYTDIKAKLQKRLPVLFSKIYKLNVEDVPIGDDLFIEMLCRHAITDKSSIFPERELCEIAVKPYILEKL